MKSLALAFVFVVSLPAFCIADSSEPPHKTMKMDQDGVLVAGEYEVISTNNSVTRALCPYSCEERSIPKANCRTWKSKNEPDKCYVQDTRLPSDAVPIGK